MQTILNAIEGRTVKSASNRISPVYNPATGEQIAALPLSTAKGANTIANAIRSAKARLMLTRRDMPGSARIFNAKARKASAKPSTRPSRSSSDFRSVR